MAAHQHLKIISSIYIEEVKDLPSHERKRIGWIAGVPKQLHNDGNHLNGYEQCVSPLSKIY